MVTKIDRLYQCDKCKLLYKDSFWVKKCEEWCKKYNSCNLKITKHSTKE